jgi:hypothetical protein
LKAFYARRKLENFIYDDPKFKLLEFYDLLGKVEQKPLEEMETSVYLGQWKVSLTSKI